MRLRSVIFALATLIGLAPAAAQQVSPNLSMDKAASGRKIYVTDPITFAKAPLWSIDGSGNWWPLLGTRTVTAVTGSGSTVVFNYDPTFGGTITNSAATAGDAFRGLNTVNGAYALMRHPDSLGIGAFGTWYSGAWGSTYGRGSWAFDVAPTFGSALSIASGGTGATTAAGARAALGISDTLSLSLPSSLHDTSVNAVATAAMVMAQAGPTLDAVRYGVKCDDSTDDTTKLQEVWTQLTTIRRRGSLVLPAGNCKFTTGLTTNASNIAIIGQGRGVTNLLFGSATGDVIAIGDGTANPNNITIRDLSIGSTVAKTSGAAIAVKNVHVLTIQNVNLDYNLYIGLDLDGGSQQFDYNVDNFNINSGAIGIRVGNTAIAQNVYVRNGLIYNTTQFGLRLINVGGYGFENVDIGSCGVGVQTFAPAGAGVNSGYFRSVHADTCIDAGWQLWTNGGILTQLDCDRCWASNTGTGSAHASGIVVDPKTGYIDGITFRHPVISHNYKHGIELDGNWTNISIENPMVCNNSTGGSGYAQGIVFNGGSHGSVVGGVSGKCGYYGGTTNNQGVGIYIASGFGDYLRIVGTDTTQNVSAGVVDVSSGIGHYIDGVAGVVTENNGIATITNTTSVNVAHGLSWGPAKDQVSLTQLSGLPSGVTNCWVAGTDGSNINIQCNATSSTTFYIGWRARVKNKSSSLLPGQVPSLALRMAA